jgi:adenine deaminase
MKIQGNLIDVHSREVYAAEVVCENGKIASVKRLTREVNSYIMPGLIDSHVHIESSMLTPTSFADIAVTHGTTCVVSDPHEIANVLGIDGVKFMIESGRQTDLNFCFGAPSCVPATEFETSGAKITATEIKMLFEDGSVSYLSEMMNFPGVIYNDRAVLEKLKIAAAYGCPVDGHAPGLTGDALKKYVEAGISTDHECSTADEAREKISLGMKILIREGSAARNLAALKPVLMEFPDMCMLCSDDIHPEMLLKRHINKLIAGLISDGLNMFDVIRAATVNPVKHYRLRAGLLTVGDPADFIIVDNPSLMNVKETWIDGKKVFPRTSESGRSTTTSYPNRFAASYVTKKDIEILAERGLCRIIAAKDGELLTETLLEEPSITDGRVVSDPERDLLKIVIKDRYSDSAPSAALVTGFGLKHGALASSVAHDSHNIVAVGVDDNDLISAINKVIEMKGGLAFSENGNIGALSLPVAGLMTDGSCEAVAQKYEELNRLVHTSGCRLAAPFMTLSFMALLVIPELKISDKGLFDGKTFSFVPLFTGE